MVYILHLNSPLAHARHYVSWTKDSSTLETRLAHHAAGHGARFTQVCVERGITWQLACVLPGDKTDERALKNKKHTSRYCPICKENHD